MSFPEIRSLIPHKDPMVLLDRVIAVDAESLCAELTITPESRFFDGAGVGAWIGIEYMAQAIAAFAGYSAQQREEAVKVGFLLGSRRYECSCSSFLLGSVLQVQVQRVLQNENGLGAFECTISDANDPNADALATATVTVFQPDNASDFLQNSSNES
ncbi:hotdog family protein [Solimicrobium silvestre]|uniref:Putative 3-hydroxylacyl-(Acyl carrier protein) dehydratase n=1 Tax=Solimicrobium silvestre TaxID=2099400 RepID=A0A2S9H574_9BURK|nr:hotdog family protein [Solimicrobium silvestre]PRC95145.1 putative 3-hydroxylacyl-(acyl carrier protein) dehydratase [Solimicrobium silvestre]